MKGRAVGTEPRPALPLFRFDSGVPTAHNNYFTFFYRYFAPMAQGEHTWVNLQFELYSLGITQVLRISYF